ncbi:hypothetical protein BROUX41_000913 [Berkeleyomyces rouxiae]|uniref:uncharacterized protein n=1 Tax=Berkeleyomyces rouxiae TaxID=2035830 RepID=UPI003B7F4CC5
MFYGNLALAIAALSSTAAAQTFSKCDPTHGDVCPPNPAFGKCNKPQSFDFTKVDSKWHKDSSFKKWWTTDDGVTYERDRLEISNNRGAKLNFKDPKNSSPLIKTNRYFFYGRVDVALQTAIGQGVVTSVVLEGDSRDEIDWEWIGGEHFEVQSNFFSKGANEFVNGKTHPVTFNVTAGMHIYSIDWTPEKIEFLVDGVSIRNATVDQVKSPSKWPQNPAQLKLGIWAGGREGMPEGTVEWAGGPTDFTEGPFKAYYQNVTITDYCGGKNSAKEYTYSDTSGTSSSINVIGGEPATLDIPEVKSEEESKAIVSANTVTDGSASLRMPYAAAGLAFLAYLII